MKSIEELRNDILSGDWEVALAASDQLAALGSNQSLSVLIPLLSSDSAKARNAAALGLREIKDNRAVEPLVQAIINPANQNSRGTMVYALQTLDCRDHFNFLFDLALQGNYECQMHSVEILLEQDFLASDEDIAKAQQKLGEYAKSQTLSDESELLIKDLSQVLNNLREK